MKLFLTTLVLMLVAHSINAANSFCFYSSKNGLVNWNVGCDFPYNDIEKKPGNFVDCMERCVNNPVCTHFASRYDGATNYCWLKTVKSSQPNNFGTRPITPSTSGLIYCGFIPMRTGDYQGLAVCDGKAVYRLVFGPNFPLL